MIHTNRIVTVGEQESIIDRPIVLYRGDREVEIEFTLVGNEFTFSEDGNVIKSVNASHGQLVLNTPSGEHMFSELAECHEGKVVFVVTKEMIDEFVEMGFYSFQIRLYDSAEMKSRVTIPPVMNGFDIRNPIAAEDETNVVDQGIVDYARIFKDQSNEELPTFDWTGAYNKTEWEHHDVITENKLNKIEDALYSINANVKETDVVMLNTLDKVKKDADKYVKEHMAEVEADVDEFERNLNTDVQKFKVDTNASMTAHKNEVSEELESVNAQLDILLSKTDFVYPEMFGAIGNGSTDDTEAFNKMFEVSKPIIFIKNAVYRIGNLTARSNINAKAPQGINVVISLFKKTSSNVLLGFGDDSKWENINFDCTENDLEWNRGTIEYRKNITIKGCSFKGFRHDSDRPNAWGIYIKGSKNILIEDCIFENNSQSDIAILEGSSNIVLNRNKGSNFHINLEPNGVYSVENISINDSTLTTLSLLENSYTIHMIDSCMVTNCKIDKINYRGANVVFTNCKIGNIYSDRAFCGSVISNNSFSTSNNLIKDYKIMNIGLSTDVTEWIVSYSPHTNNLERISTNFGSCLRINPEHKSTTVTIKSKKYEVDSNTIYMLRVKSASHYKEDSSYISNFGSIILHHNDGITTSNGLAVHQSPSNTEHSTNPEYNCCFINTGDNITHIQIELSNGNGSRTTSAVDFYSIELMRVVTEISSNPTYNDDKVYIDTLYSEKINVAGNKNINLIGDTVYLTQPIAGGYLGYVCTASGNPGVWKGFGLIES